MAAVALVAPACGGKGGGRTSATTAVDSPTGAFGGEGAAVEDRAQAEKALLQAGDFPPGWVASPDPPVPDDPDLERQLAGCMNVEPAQVGQTASTVDSADFRLDGARQEVQSSVGLADTAAQQRERLALFERPEMAACLTTVVAETIRKGIESPDPAGGPPASAAVGAVATERIDFPAVGDGTLAYRVAIPVEAAGRQVTVYADLVVAISGRAGARLTFLSLGSPFPPELAVELTRRVVDRLPAS